MCMCSELSLFRQFQAISQSQKTSENTQKTQSQNELTLSKNPKQSKLANSVHTCVLIFLHNCGAQYSTELLR